MRRTHETPALASAKAGAQRLLLPAMIAAFGLLLVMQSGLTPIREPDTAGYLAFAAVRTAAYPLLLRGVAAVTGDAGHVIVLQIVAVCAALWALGRAIGATTGSVALAIGIVATIAANPALNRYHWSILTESLTVSFTILALALVLRLLERPRPALLAALSAVAGLAIAVRPAAASFAPWLLLVLIVVWQSVPSRAMAVLATVGPLLGLLAGEAAIRRHVHPNPDDALLPRMIFAKGALVDSPGPNPFPAGHPYRALWQTVEDDARPIRRLVAGIPDAAARHLVETIYEVELQFRFAEPEIAAAARASAVTGTDAMRAVGLARLSSAPRDYARMTSTHYLALWTPYAPYRPAAVAALGGHLDRLRPLPLADANGALARPPETRRFATLLDLVTRALGLLTALAASLFAWAWWRDRLSSSMAAAGLFALLVHGSFALVALSNIGIPRYALALWPAIVASLAFLGLALAEHFRARQRSESGVPTRS